jgi:hypothetical protein
MEAGFFYFYFKWHLQVLKKIKTENLDVDHYDI